MKSFGLKEVESFERLPSSHYSKKQGNTAGLALMKLERIIIFKKKGGRDQHFSRDSYAKYAPCEPRGRVSCGCLFMRRVGLYPSGNLCEIVDWWSAVRIYIIKIYIRIILRSGDLRMWSRAFYPGSIEGERERQLRKLSRISFEFQLNRCIVGSVAQKRERERCCGEPCRMSSVSQSGSFGQKNAFKIELKIWSGCALHKLSKINRN